MVQREKTQEEIDQEIRLSLGEIGKKAPLAKPKLSRKLLEKKVVGRPLHELVILEKFTVDYVISTSHAVNISPESEVVYGGRSSTYSGGYTSEVHLQVTPEDHASPIRELIFKGISTVRGGDYIVAIIPRYTEVNAEYNRQMRSFGAHDKQKEPVYVNRELNHTEQAIELNIILRGEELEVRIGEGYTSDAILRTERSVDYSRFIKE